MKDRYKDGTAYTLPFYKIQCDKIYTVHIQE